MRATRAGAAAGPPYAGGQDRGTCRDGTDIIQVVEQGGRPPPAACVPDAGQGLPVLPPQATTASACMLPSATCCTWCRPGTRVGSGEPSPSQPLHWVAAASAVLLCAQCPMPWSSAGQHGTAAWRPGWPGWQAGRRAGRRLGGKRQNRPIMHRCPAPDALEMAKARPAELAGAAGQRRRQRCLPELFRMAAATSCDSRVPHR